MTNRKKAMIALVKEEAKKLRKAATPKELRSLDFNKLVPNDSTYCVYGQMTGNCWSERAKELIESCAKRVYAQPNAERMRDCKLNGAPKKVVRDDYFSPIEVFIDLPDNQENNKALVDYLKGKTNRLNLK